MTPHPTTRPSKIRDCLYGASGSGKSEACARLIEDVYRTTGKKARVVIGDGSRLTYEGLWRAGIVEFCEFTMQPWPASTLKRLAKGWWPAGDSATGMLQPPGPELAQIGVYIFEGLSVAAQYAMGHVEGGMAWRAARGEKTGPDASIRIVDGHTDQKTGKVVEGPGEAYGTNGQAHYGFVQNLIQETVQESHRLNVDVVIWTAHEATNNPEKDLNKELIIGPEVIGKQLTASIPRIFGNTLHCCTVAKRTKQQDTFTGRAIDELDVEYRLYTRDHFSPSGATLTRYRAVTRSVDGEFPQYLTSTAPGLTLPAYYAKLIESTDSRMAQLTAAVTGPSEEMAAGRSVNTTPQKA